MKRYIEPKIKFAAIDNKSTILQSSTALINEVSTAPQMAKEFVNFDEVTMDSKSIWDEE